MKRKKKSGEKREKKNFDLFNACFGKKRRRRRRKANVI
jgi:hypothetical protein